MNLIRHLSNIYKQYISSWRLSNGGDFPTTSFVFLCLFIAYVAVYLTSKGSIQSGNIGNIISALSIFIGLLINMLMPFFTFIESEQSKEIKKVNNETEAQRKKRQEQNLRIDQYEILFSDITFTMLLSILSLVFLFIAGFVFESRDQYHTFSSTQDLMKNALPMIVLFFFYCCLFFGFVNILKIIVAANALIYPRLSSSNRKRNQP